MSVLMTLALCLGGNGDVPSPAPMSFDEQSDLSAREADELLSTQVGSGGTGWAFGWDFKWYHVALILVVGAAIVATPVVLFLVI